MKTDLCPNGTFFSVMAQGEAMAAVFAAMASNAQSPAAFRLAGGCSGMTDAERARVLPYFVEALQGFSGLAISGATASGDGKPMVTNVPSALVAAGNPCIAMGTVPRTADMSLPESGSVCVSGYGDTIDLGQHGVAVIQRNASEVLDWDGDLTAYLDFLEGLQDDADWTVGVVVFNGGGVTKKEITQALDRGLPLIVVRGSGRAADEFATQWFGGEGSFDEELLQFAVENKLVAFADFSDAATLRQAFQEFNLL